MSVLLSPETQALIEERMRRGGYSTADDVVRVALDVLHQVEDDGTDDSEMVALRASIEQMKRGEVIDWTDLSAELRRKHLA
jgi:Arc/MetJ-type ribon-helix-helix transcriptional regulator